MEDFSLLYNINTNVSKNQGDKKKNRVSNFNISKSNMLLESLAKFFSDKDSSKLKEQYKNMIGSLNNDYLAAAIFLAEKHGDEKNFNTALDKCINILKVPKNKKNGAIITLVSYYYKVLSFRSK